MNKNKYFTFCGLIKILIFQQCFVFAQEVASIAQPPQNKHTPHKQTSLKVVLTDFERRFKVYFTFESNLVRDKFVSNDLRITENLEENLRNILTPMNLRFTRVSERYYTISQEVLERKTPTSPTLPNPSDNNRNDLGSANTTKQIALMNVSGKILDESGSGMPGVNILEKGTKNGVTSDKNGNYSISVANENSILMISSVGYSSQEVVVGKRTQINITLEPDIKSLSEIVVVGYGEQKRKNVSSSIATVGQADIESRPTTNAYQALQGLAGNVTIQQNSAEPGTVPVFNIRGVGSFSSNNEPLILVDGLNVGTLGFANINPSDIESINILKDASSAAVYGSQAGAGVVLVTTKKGQKDQKPTLRYSGMMGIQNPTALPKAVEAWEFMTMKNEALVNSGLAPQFSPDQISEQRTKGSYPWLLEEQFRSNTPQVKHDVSISGGGRNTNYIASFGYFNQENMLNNKYVQQAQNEFYYKRYNARLGVNTDISDILKVGMSASYMKSYNRTSPFGSSGNTIRDALRTPRIYPIVNEDGSFPTFGSYSNNTLALLSLGGFRMLETDNITGTFDVTLTPLAGLRFNANLSGNYFQYNQSTQVRAFSYNSPYPSDPPRNNQYSKEAWKDYNTNIYFTGEYEKSFGNHTAKMMVGYRSDYFSNFDYLSAYRFNTIPLNSELFTQGGFELSNGSVVGTADRYSNYVNPQLAVLNSYFGRFNYNYNDKYILEFTWRYDGSSKLSPDARWLFYPAVSAAWRLTSEPFMQNFKDKIGNAKIRFSHGKVGNSGIGGYLYVPRIQLVNGAYAFNNSSTAGANILPYNSELQWASVTSTNVGFDLELLKNRLGISFDYFRSLNDGIYYSPVVPGLFGQSSPVQNFASVLNRGWEVSLNYNLKTGPVSHTFNLNVADNFNTIEKLGADNITEVDSRTLLREGFPISTYYMFKSDGLFQNIEQVEAAAKQPFAQNGQAQPGDIRFVDKNGDGVIDAQDRFTMGNPFPRYTFGFTYKAVYKGFDLSLFLQGVGQRSQYLRGDAVEAFHNNEEHLYYQHKDRWTPTNPGASYPRLTATVAANSNNIVLSDYWLYDTSYLRLKNLQVGYSLPSKLLSKVGMKTARVYVSGQNLLTLMPSRLATLGIDPEFTQFGNRLSFENYSAIAGRSYPNTKVVAVGLDVSF
jgi:TonB-linked SusC/RagA family outer membrane protein